MAEELLPDLKHHVDQNTYLQRVFFTILGRYNLHHKKELKAVVREKLLEYVPQEEWLRSEFGKGFTERGRRRYFGG